MATAKRLWIMNLLILGDVLVGYRFRQDYYLPLVIPYALITIGIVVYGFWILLQIWGKTKKI